MKKKLILLLALVLVMGSFAACGGSDDSGDADVIKIGVNYELTGEVATYGNDSKDGIEMAIEEINADGGVLGKKIELVTKDNKSDPAEATLLAEGLFTEDKVIAGLGPATSGDFSAVIQSATTHGIPVISSSATADDEITTDKDGKVREFVFRTCFTDSYQGKTMAVYAMDKLNAKKAVILKDTSSDYGKGLADNFRAVVEKAGGEIVAEEGYMNTDKDFNAVLTSIKNKEFDVMFVPGYYQQAGLIIKQARELGIDVPILGADGFDSPELVGLAGADAASDIYFSNHYSSLDTDPKVKEFIAAFNEKFDKDPSAFNAMGYDLGMYIADAIERAGEASPEAVTKALASTEEFVGVTGAFSVDADHNVVKDVVVIKMDGGKQVSAEKISVK